MSGLYNSFARSPITLFALAVAAVPTDPTITAPAVLPRQNNDQFIGWVEYSGSWYSETCNAGLTWYQDGKYGQCCPVTLAGCYAPTGCISGSLIYPYPDISSTRTIACTENFDNPALSICNTAFIFENMADSSPKTDIVCGSLSVNWSYYRKLPASATEVSSNAPLSIPQPVSTALTAPNVTQSARGGASKAWIAGVVVGPVIGLALTGAAIILFLRRKKNKHLAPEQGSAAMSSAHPSMLPTGVGGSTEAKPEFAQQQPAFHAGQYANQGAFATQQSYANSSLSPTSLHTSGAPVSPPPQQTRYGNSANDDHLASELSSAAPAPSTRPPTELDAASGQDGTVSSGPAELRTTTSNDNTP